MTRETITYKGLSIRDPAPYGEAGLAWQENFVTIADTLDSLQGSLDTALGGLVIGTDIQAHSANLDAWSSVAPSADGQSLVAADDYAAMRGLLGFTTPILDRASPGDIGVTTPGAGTFSQATIRQAADGNGWIAYGYDDQSTKSLKGYVRSTGDSNIEASNALTLRSGNATAIWSAVGYGIAIYAGKDITVYDSVHSYAERLRISLTGELSIPSDTVGLALDAAGTTKLISDGTTATLSKPLKAAGYKSSDGSPGITKTITIKDADDMTHTLTFKDGLLTSHTEA